MHNEKKEEMQDFPLPDNFEQLHRAEESIVFHYILERVTDYETAQDLTVGVFVQAYRSWREYQANPTILASEWIYKIAEAYCDDWRQRGEKPIRDV